MTTPQITKHMQMQEILRIFPGARRALFQRYHVGGCSTCGFQPTDTLEEVCRNHKLRDADEVIEHLKRSHELDQALQISPMEVAEQLRRGEGLKLLDVRTPEEHDIARIEGALLVTEENAEEIMNWQKDTMIVFFCHHGDRSLDAASYFLAPGFFMDFLPTLYFVFFSPICLFGINAIKARNALLTLSESGK
ncbi:MAG: molybdopterin-synthase sulfurylase [Candidatus Dadabacteria bacterium]|nr:molybdopterin-synthase sulfurylase [Candidatus Dadabacteria bacterium]